MENRDLTTPERRTPPRTLGARDFAAVGVRWRGRVVAVFVAVMMIAVYVAFSFFEFESVMKILVKRERADPLVAPDQNRPEIARDLTEEELNAEVELLKSDDVLQKVVMEAGLQRRARQPLWYRFVRGNNAAGEDVLKAKALRDLYKRVEVTLPRKSNVIRVSYRSEDPALAVAVLTSLSHCYLEKHMAVHRPPGQFQFFAQQADLFRTRLLQTESRLANLPRSGGTLAGPLEIELIVKELGSLRAEEARTQTAINEAQKKSDSLQTQLSSTPARMQTLVRVSDNQYLMMQLKNTLLSLELKRTELLKKFQPSYRDVVEVDQQIAQTRAAIAGAQGSPPRDETTDRDPTYEWMRSEVAKARTELVSLNARADSLRKAIAETETYARRLNERSLEQQDVQRMAKALDETYQLYLRKREEARISDALDQSKILNASITQKPTVPVLPTRSPWVIVFGGLIAATVLSLGTAFISEAFDTSFRTPDEVQWYLDVPVLAILPPAAPELRRG